jgi:hypothetical protein
MLDHSLLALSRREHCSVFALQPYLTRAVRPQEYSTSCQSMDGHSSRVDWVLVGRGQVVLSERSVFLRALEHSRRRSILSSSSSEAKKSGRMGLGRERKKHYASLPRGYELFDLLPQWSRSVLARKMLTRSWVLSEEGNRVARPRAPSKTS